MDQAICVNYLEVHIHIDEIIAYFSQMAKVGKYFILAAIWLVR